MDSQTTVSSVVSGDGPGAGYVKASGIIGLAAYLLAFTVAVLLGLHQWWPTCDPTPANAAAPGAVAAGRPPAHVTPETVGPKAPAQPAATGASGATGATSTTGASEASGNPNPTVKVKAVTPTSGDVAGGAPVQIAGEGFQDNPTVTFGGSPATVQTASKTSIAATTPAHAEGAVDVIVTNGDQSTGKLPAGYTYTSCTSQCRSRLLLLVLLAGALGGCFHALRSLWMFVGNRNLKQSWALMYIFLPIGGAALAFIFFILISAGSGFFAQPKDSNSCFWIIGIAALVGLFSQQAAEKLKKIAESFFTTVPPKADSLAGLSITSISPSGGPLAGGTSVTIAGTGFTNKSAVTFGGAPGENVKFVSSTSISADTPKATTQGPVDVMVTDPGSAVKAVKPQAFTYH